MFVDKVEIVKAFVVINKEDPHERLGEFEWDQPASPKWLVDLCYVEGSGSDSDE